MKFRGSMPAPKREHGDVIKVGGLEGVIYHRRHYNNHWEYGLLFKEHNLVIWVRE